MRVKRSNIFARRYTQILVIASCLLFTINIIVPDGETSTAENRSLQTFPSFEKEDVMNGNYGTELTNWFSDQFVGRNFFIHLRYGLSRLSGQTEINHVFIGKNRLLEDINQENSKQLKRNIKAMNTFASNYEDVNMSFVLSPTATNIYSEDLPNFATTIDQNEQMDSIYDQLSDSIKNIDIRDTFTENKDAELFYKTDHHWTSMGAFYAFSEIADQLDIADISINNYTIYPVESEFRGTLANATGNFTIHDEIDIFVPEEEVEYIVTNDTTQTKSRTIYDSSALDSDNPYNVFLSGNSSLIQIDTKNDSDKHLLVIKDSYANSLIPFLLPYYRTITVVDPRYYTDDLNTLMETQLITDVMYIYNTNTFVQDTSLADVLNN